MKNVLYKKIQADIDRYLLNQLSEQELVEFELYYLENPDVLEQIDIQRALLEALQDDGVKAPGAVKADATAQPSIAGMIMGWFQSPRVVAANFAVIALVMVLVVSPESKNKQAMTSADRLWLGQIRSGESRPVSVQRHSASLVLDIEVPLSAAIYQVELLNSEGNLIYKLGSIRAADSSLLIVLDSTVLAGQTYQLNVSDPEGERVLSHAIEIEP